jgi:ribonuclease E/ribonuclease G
MGWRLIVVETDASGLRAALTIDGRLQAVEIDRGSPVGAVTSAKVIRTVTGLGTFVALADGTELLLDRAGDKSPLPSGKDILVQIVKPQRGGKAGIASARIALTGLGFVHLPLESGLRFSRRLSLAPERRTAIESFLAGLPGGWIVRRMAAELAPDDLGIEARMLADEGRQAQAGGLKAPDAFRRLISDYGADAIQVAGLAAKASVERWCGAFAPSLAARVETEPAGAFEFHDLDEAIAALAERRVELPSGVSLVIEATEALTAIDVNAGPEANVLGVNLDAAEEIARQLRLRHIGGIVVIDFVSMPRRQDQGRVVAALQAALADDPSQTHVLPMSAFGLVEMTRERRGPGLEF